MSDAWLESCGLKKKQRCELVHSDRSDLFEDLLEEDTSVFPLLDVPPEVLTTVGIFLDARHLTTLSQLNAQAQTQLDDALADAWSELLLRDYAFRSRAKRYKAFGSADGEAQRAFNGSAGLVLTAVDNSRVEWDGLLVAAPAHLRYRFFDTMRVMKSRWGKSAQSWEWFATRILHRLTYDQVERHVLGYTRPSHSTAAADEFDEVLHQATLDRDGRQRRQECSNSRDVIASVKKSLGIATACDHSAQGGASILKQEAGGERSAEAADGREDETKDMFSALAPTAQDQRIRKAERATATPANEHETPTGCTPFEMPAQQEIERMSFSDQLELALRVSSKTTLNDAEPIGTSPGSAEKSTPPNAAALRETGAGAENDNEVLLRLKVSRTRIAEEPLEVVMKVFTVGDTLNIPEQLRRPTEQVSLRLTRNNWLLFYEGIAAEAQLRARAFASKIRRRWQSPSSDRLTEARSCLDLEAEMLQLAIFRTKPSAQSEASGEHQVSPQELEEESRLRDFLEMWQEHEAWAVSLEEHLGPLDLEVSRERTNNMQQGRSHTPYAADLLRLAFRNFAICEARIFFRLAQAVYGLISRLCGRQASETRWQLLEDLYEIANGYTVQDDVLAKQRKTLQEYKYYFIEPLKRACGSEPGNGNCQDDDLEC